MSLYNMVFGMNPDADKLLSLLGKTAGDFGRFRNVYMEDGYIVVHTRNGGGNREDYEDVFDEMSDHPWYSHDADDDFDCTYAYFYFRVPEAFKPIFETFKDLGAGKDLNPTEKFAKMIEDLQNGNSTPETERALEVGKSIVEQIGKAIDDA